MPTLLAGGTNNQAWLVETRGGPSYVLRLASAVSDHARFFYEEALLRALQTKALPFHLPYPLPARNGQGFVSVVQDSQPGSIATLTHWLPGVVPDRNAFNIAMAGEALAVLDRALATLDVAELPARTGDSAFQYGDLTHCHALVTDPVVALEKLIEPVPLRAMAALFEQVQHDWELLNCQDLPRQIVHRDCGPGNVLMDGGRVSAILDFEFAGMDHRIFDFCVALSWWPVRLMGTGQEWELINALGRAYVAQVPLSQAELHWLPTTLRMRDTTALVYRVGRYLAGLETRQTIQERVQHSLWREAWLTANHDTLLRTALSW